MRRDGSVYDTKQHSSLIYRQLHPDGHHLHLEEHLHMHANMHIKKNIRQKKVYMEKHGNTLKLGDHSISHRQWGRLLQAECGTAGSSASVCRWLAHLGGPGGGVLWLRCCLRPGWADLQAAWGHVPGILPEQPGGGQNSHTAAACTSGV